MKNTFFLQDPYTAIISGLDQGFLLLYRHVHRNSHRIARLAITLLPLMALLVGSCKTSQLPFAYGSNASPEQFRTALFPDRVNFKKDGYFPAAGYISSARSYVEETPPALMMLTRTEIAYLFGKPTLHRQDADAEVWQYTTKKCVVDFYFYGKNELSHLDVRLKKTMTAGKRFSTDPVSDRTQSRCLSDVKGDAFDNIPA